MVKIDKIDRYPLCCPPYNITSFSSTVSLGVLIQSAYAQTVRRTHRYNVMSVLIVLTPILVDVYQHLLNMFSTFIMHQQLHHLLPLALYQTSGQYAKHRESALRSFHFPAKGSSLPWYKSVIWLYFDNIKLVQCVCPSFSQRLYRFLPPMRCMSHKSVGCTGTTTIASNLK